MPQGQSPINGPNLRSSYSAPPSDCVDDPTARARCLNISMSSDRSLVVTRIFC